MGKISKSMVRWQLLSMRIHVVLSGRHFKVGRAFSNLIFREIGVRGRRRKLVGLEEGEGSLEKERASFEEQKGLVNYLFIYLFV